MNPIRTHDALFRYVFGEPEQFAELLAALLPPTIAAAIDWATLRRLDGSFVDHVLQDRRTDLLFEARIGRHRVLIHLLDEFKSRDERLASWQVSRYVVRIIDRWLLEHPDERGLPVVLPVVVYHGERRWRSPHSPRWLVDLRGLTAKERRWLRRHQLHLPFVLLDLSRLGEGDLEALRVSAVTGLTLRFVRFLRHCAPADAEAYIVQWRWLIARLLDHPRGKDVLVALVSWWFARSPANEDTLRAVMKRIDTEDTPMKTLLDVVLELGANRGRQEGMEQGMQQGMQQGELAALRALLERQLAARFGPLVAGEQSRLAAAEAATLQRWGERLVVAAHREDVFAEDR